MSEPDGSDLRALIEAMAQMLELPVGPDNMAAVELNLRIARQMAAKLAEFSLPDDSEPAPVFRA